MCSISLLRVCHPSTLRIVIWPEDNRAQSSIGTVSVHGIKVRVLILRRTARSGVRSCRPHHFPFQPPLAKECLPAAGFNIGRRVGIDHVAVVIAQLLVYVLRGVTEPDLVCAGFQICRGRYCHDQVRFSRVRFLCGTIILGIYLHDLRHHESRGIPRRSGQGRTRERPLAACRCD